MRRGPIIFLALLVALLSGCASGPTALSKTTLPATAQGAPVVTNIYDNADRLVKTLDPYLQPTLYTNDLNGRVLSVTDPLSRTTRLDYDADGRQLASINAGNATNRQTWDARSSLLQLTDGAGHFSTRAYDAGGNQIYLTNRNGKVWTFYYDGANRLTNTVTPLGRSTILTFNHQGLVATIKDPASQLTSLYYDAKGRLTNRTDVLATTYYGYDANDNRTNVTETFNLQPSTCNYTYDAYNRVQTYKDTSGNLIQYKYDANGNVTNLIYPGNKTVTYAYDSLNQLTNVTDWSGRKSSISYDLASRITGIKRPNGSYRTISYDVAGQATNIYEQMSNSLPIAVFKYAWTNTGNMAWEFTAPLPHPVTVPTRTMTYDIDNRLKTVNGATTTNDLNGNLTCAPLTNGVFTNYVYDARNRLKNAGGVTNTYDALNNRIGQTYGTNVTTYVVNPNAKLPQVLMRIKNGITNYYIYGAGLLYQITETAPATNTLTYHYDYRGSTIALSDSTGKVTDRIEYALYGLTTYRVGTNDTPFLFNGRYGVQTDNNGLLYMRARYYNPYLCRFISADPSGFAGGLNHYAYANGNPVSYIDPFGLNKQATGDNSFSWYASIQTSLGNEPLDYSQPAAANSADMWNYISGRTANAPANAMDNLTIGVANGLLTAATMDFGGLGGGLSLEAGLAARGVAAEGTMAVSPYRVTTAGETFQHYSYMEHAESLQGGLWPNSYGTRVQGLSGAEAQSGLSLPHATPPNAVYTVTPNPGTLIQVNPIARPLYGQPGGLPEVRFIFGTEPGTISGPMPIR